MNKEETDLIIAEQNKNTEEILKAVAKVKSDYHELCKLKDMRIAELEEENSELKEKLEIEKNARGDWFGKAVTKDRRLTEAKEIILRLYNAGRDVLMCRAEEKAYDNLSNAINDKSIEQFLKEIKEK